MRNPTNSTNPDDQAGNTGNPSVQLVLPFVLAALFWAWHCIKKRRAGATPTLSTPNGGNAAPLARLALFNNDVEPPVALAVGIACEHEEGAETAVALPVNPTAQGSGLGYAAI